MSKLTAHLCAFSSMSRHGKVIRDGRIAEEGSHQALLALNGEYARLYHTQNVGETYGQA